MTHLAELPEGLIVELLEEVGEIPVIVKGTIEEMLEVGCVSVGSLSRDAAHAGNVQADRHLKRCVWPQKQGTGWIDARHARM